LSGCAIAARHEEHIQFCGTVGEPIVATKLRPVSLETGPTA
jgi:hypothetical protein